MIPGSLPDAGLSPRMRGSPESSLCHILSRGPIPAHAGEPGGATGASFAVRAYPRACGGAHSGADGTSSDAGLSPRMRGSPGTTAMASAVVGPIPAHAGEPGLVGHRRSSRGAYPRACGGAVRERCCVRGSTGLSPRMRGSLRDTEGGDGIIGPIPAHAGEPGLWTRSPPACGAYPRACGGAGSRLRSRRSARGLSPRMRGSHACRSRASRMAGPIPAHAGEPRHRRSRQHSPGAYPRACGGAGCH